MSSSSHAASSGTVVGDVSGDNIDRSRNIDTETIRLRAQRCQELVEAAAEGRMSSGEDFVKQLRESGASTGECEVYLDQLDQLMSKRGPVSDPKGKGAEGTGGDEDDRRTPEGLEGDELADFRKKRDDVAAERERK